MEEINRTRAGDNIRLEESEILARKLYSFFQQNKSDVYPEVCTGIGNMIDQLLTGRTCQIRRRLTRVEEDGGGKPSREINALWNKIAAYEKKYKISTYSVYQLVIAEHTDQYRFVSYRGVEKRGLSVQRSNYRMVYNKELTPADTLDTILMR